MAPISSSSLSIGTPNAWTVQPPSVAARPIAFRIGVDDHDMDRASFA